MHKYLILFGLILASAFSAMAEAALLSVSRFKIKHWIEKKRFGAIHVKKLKDNPETILATTLIINNLANTAAAAITTSISLEIFNNNAIGIATGIATFLILVFGDIIPKSVATNNNEVVAPLVAPVIWNLSVLIYPLTALLDLFLKLLDKIFGKTDRPMMTREELKFVVKASEEEGSIKDIEKKLIQRVFDFSNTTVSDVMTRKKLITYVSSEMKIGDVLKMSTIKIYSRFPVYEKSKENIVGILYLKDMLFYSKEGKLDLPIKSIMRKPFFVFENKKVDSMLKLFQQRKEHMAIVINNKAQVVGIVTIENILEEIVGEIIDESDKINPSLVQLSKSEWVARGTSEIEEVNSKTGLQIKESDFDSLNSFISSTLGRSPKIGEEIAYQNYKMVMEDVQGKKVLSVKIIKTG